MKDKKLFSWSDTKLYLIIIGLMVIVIAFFSIGKTILKWQVITMVC